MLRLLSLDLVDAEGLGAEVVSEGRGFLARGDGDGARDGDDEVGAVEGVLTVHVVAVEGDGLGLGGAVDSLEIQRDGLGGVGGVDHLDDDLARLAVIDAGGEKSVLSGLSGDRLLLHGEREHVGALVHGEELLDVVADGTERAKIVEPDGIGTPLPTLDVGEEGSVSSHVDDVGIALDARHVGSLIERGLKVVPLLAVGTVAGIFAGKHTGTFAVVRVVAQTVGEEPLLVAVVVLVVEIYLELLHARLQQVEVPAFGIGACGADEF